MIMKKKKESVFLIFLFAVLGVIVFSLFCFKTVKQSGKVSASAEELNKIAEYGGIDYSDYPSANILPYPFSYVHNSSLIDYTYNADGSININGTIPSGSYVNFEIRRTGELFLDPGTYSVELFGVNGQRIILVTGCTNCTLPYHQGLKRQFTLIERDTIGNFVIQVQSGTYENLTLKVQFSKSDIYYPYSVPVAIQYENGKEQGYDEGYVSGQEQGYNNALTAFQRGIFNEMQVSAEYNYGGQYNTRNENVPYTYGTDYVNFADFYESIKQRNGIDLSYIKLTFVFSGDYLYYYYPLYVYGAFVNGTVYGENSAFNFDTGLSEGVGTNAAKDEVIKIVPNTPESIPADNFIYSYIEITLYTARDLADFRLISPSGNYNVGYQAGYQSGKQDGFEIGEVNGYDRGEQIGFDKGFIRGREFGYQDGLKTAQNGSLVVLLAAIADVPMSIASDFLSFEVLGVDMFALFTGLLTLLLVVKVIRYLI